MMVPVKRKWPVDSVTVTDVTQLREQSPNNPLSSRKRVKYVILQSILEVGTPIIVGRIPIRLNSPLFLVQVRQPENVGDDADYLSSRERDQDAGSLEVRRSSKYPSREDTTRVGEDEQRS